MISSRRLCTGTKRYAGTERPRRYRRGVVDELHVLSGPHPSRHRMSRRCRVRTT